DDMLAELIERGEARQRSLQAKTRDGAPNGLAAIGAAFREQMLIILSESRPDASEARWRQWAGDVWRGFGDSELDPQKHAKQFKAGFVTREDALFESMLKHIAAGRICVWGLIGAGPAPRKNVYR